jgi:hypothetical protein
MEWIRTKIGELDALFLNQVGWEIQVLPGLGGKISSIRSQGRELLAKNPRKAFTPARYAAPYAEFDASGFDECFPTIGPCAYPDFPWAGIEMPDHGELWSLPWSWQAAGDQLRLETRGIRVPYQFTKTLSITAAGAIRFQYRVSNPTPFPFRFLWSAHPLFAPQPGMRIVLPSETRVLVDYSKNDRLGEVWQEHAWPLTQDCHGRPVDLGLVLGPEAGLVDKLYTTPLSEGWCAFYHPRERNFAAFVFSAQQIPYVGLSINMGGWPFDAPGYYNLGLEPCSGFPDRLDLAIRRGACPTLAACSTQEWEMQLHTGYADHEAALKSTLSHLARSLYPGCSPSTVSNTQEALH